MIKVSGPWITQRELDYVADAAANGWLEKATYYPERFERAFAEFIGMPYAVALPSCTAALHLSLLGLGIGPGDEVAVPEVTWIATAAPISYVGATPVFVDIDPVTWCMSPRSLAERITPRTKAVIPVDLYGGMVDMHGIREVTEPAGIRVIEDAAQAIGSVLHGQKAGSRGDIGVFSFHGSKTITTGEGGMLVTAHKDVYERVTFLNNQGRRDRSLYNYEIGHKYKMSAMQAAMGLAQLERLDEIVARKRLIFEWYREELGNVPELALNAEPLGMRSSYWMVTIVDHRGLPMNKDALVEEMKKLGIETRPIHYPLSSMPAFSRYTGAGGGRSLSPEAYRISENGINLPSGLQLTRDDVAYVSSVVRKLLGVEHAG